MLAMDPMCFLICLYNAFAYGILYLLFEAYPIEFGHVRHWNLLNASLPFLGTFIGIMIGAGFQAWYSRNVFAPAVDRAGGRAEPEVRLPPMILGGCLMPIGFFWFAWTSKAHWINSVLAGAIVGTAFLLIFQSGINYLIDVYEMYGASAIACNTFMRSILAASFPLVARPMYSNLGVGWATSLLGFISIALACVPMLFYKYGSRIRKYSKWSR